MDFYFLGGIFTDTDISNIKKLSNSTIQYAADALQKNYIKGFSDSSLVNSLTVVNLPFIGSYPKKYKTIFYKPCLEQEYIKRAKIINIKFCNIFLIKNMFRFFLSIKKLLNAIPSQKNKVVLVSYSMHLPFLLSCFILRALRKNVYWCLIAPDLPEYMSSAKGIKKIILTIVGSISYYIANKANCIVVITKEMGFRFNNKIEKILIEGIADIHTIETRARLDKKKKYFLYSGTLDRRYGIRTLVEAYLKSNVTDYDLYICGDGDEKKYVEKMSFLNPKIKYLGQIDRNSVLRLQKNAFLLINPRQNTAEYTKFSFPSKVIEYMSSGTPVLMFKLDGIPDEYYKYCFISEHGTNNLSKKIFELSKMHPIILKKKGDAAQEFIIKFKSPNIQVQKILDIITRR